jgi:IS30 family transposase
MPNQKAHEFMNNLDRCNFVVLQSSTKGGMSAVEIAKKLGKHRTTVHRYLNTLEYMGKVENEHGTWRVKKGQQTIKPLESEIVIEIPIPKKQWVDIALLEILAKDAEEAKFLGVAKTCRILIEKERESRTIKIKGKNIDDLDLEKLGSMIQQASAKSSKINLRGLLKSLKIPHSEN